MGRSRNEEIVAPGGLKVYNDEGTTLLGAIGAPGGMVLNDSAGNELLKGPSSPVASAINEITITNGAANTAPSLVTTGGSTNVGITLSGKGTGTVTLGQATGTVTIVDGVNVVIGGTTGTMIGTTNSAKIGFFGATAIVRPVSANQAQLAGSATNGAIVTTVNEILNVLVNLGLAKGGA